MARWIQSVCRTSVVAAVVAAGAVAVGAGPASASGALQLYVDRGAAGTECTHDEPCPSIQAAVDVAGTTSAVVHLPKGDFLDQSTQIAAGQQISVVGSGLDYVNDGAIEGDRNHNPVFTNRGSLSLTNVLIEPYNQTGIDQIGGALTLHNVSVGNGYPDLAVHDGTVSVTDSTLGGGAASESPMTTVDGGVVTLDNVGASRISQSAGNLTIRNMAIGYHGLDVSGGHLDVRDSVLANLYAVTVTGTAAALLQRVRSNSSTAVTVDGAVATARIVQSGFYADNTRSNTTGVLTATNGGRVSIAGSVIDGFAGQACDGPVVDGGYNTAFDATCALSEPTSRNSLDHVLRVPTGVGIADGDYGPVDPDPFAEDPPQVNPLVDAIPVGARASFDPAIELCAPGSADQRGQIRPAGKGCDIGAVELAPVTVHISVERTHLHTDEIAVVHASVSLGSTAAAQPLKGSIEFGFSAALRCRAVRVNGPTTATCRYHMVPEYKDASVTFVAAGPTRSTRVVKPIQVDRAPLRVGINAPSSVRRGHRVTVGVSVRNDVTDTPLQSYAYLYFRTAKRDWYRVTHVITGKDGRASYTFTPGRNVLFQWRIAANSYYERGVSRSVHTTVR